MLSQNIRKSMIPWILIEQPEQLKRINESSAYSIVFKHSTRCIISKFALQQFEQEWDQDIHVSPYFLDILQNRSISNQIANQFDVQHESPQLLVIKNGQCVYHSSHEGIQVRELKNFLQKDSAI